MEPDNEAYVYGLVLGRVIASLRERRGMSQGELAGAAGITQSTLSRMERGQAQPDAFTLKKLSEALGVSVAELTAWVDKALERSRQATIGAIGDTSRPAEKSWWQAALKIAGAAGLAGLVAFAVSAALDNPPKRTRPRKKP